MPDTVQKAQNAPDSTKKGSGTGRGNPYGSTILARLRAGEKVEGYYLDGNNRLRRNDSEPTAREPAGEFDRLKAMRHCLANPPSSDKTAGEKACRAWLEKAPGPFMETYDKLEAQAKRDAKIDVGEEEEVEPTEDDDALRDQINELLMKHAARAKR